MSACLPSSPTSPEAMRVLALMPSDALTPEQIIRLSLAGVPKDDYEPRLKIFSSAAREWPFKLVATESFAEWEIHPGEPWPVDDQMMAVIYDEADGIISEHLLTTSESPIESTARITLLGPEPGVFVPPNVQHLVLAVSPNFPPVRRFRLKSLEHEIVAPVIEVLSEGRYLVSIPQGGQTCLGLCPRTDYEITADGLKVNQQKSYRIQTGTIADHQSPDLQFRQFDLWGDFLRITVELDELATVHARIWTTDQTPLILQTIGAPSRKVVLESPESLMPKSNYEGEIIVTDFCGQQTTFTIPAFTTVAQAEVEITEVVATPLHDWSDNLPNNDPYDRYPGNGTVSSVDEWIELRNVSNETIVIGQAGIYVRVIDASPTETWLSNAPAIRIGDSLDGNTWKPGEFLVFRPFGTLNQTDYIIEVFSGRRRLDRLVIGDQMDSSHSGGRPPDLAHEALAKDNAGYWRWCRPTPGHLTIDLDCL